MTWIHIKENSKIIWHVAHRLYVRGFKGQIYVLFAIKGLKVTYGNYYMFLGMILETSKVKKWSMGFKRVYRGTGKAIKV